MPDNDISKRASDISAQAIEWRRDFHRHPEIAFEEVRTAGIIAEHLRSLGLEPRTGVGKTGVVAVLDTGRPGRTVLARADIDALPVTEETEHDYRSTIDGRMHACGHDGHTAVLMSVASLLVARRDQLSGKVVFVFQPAEEIVGGAAAMLADGALDGLTVDASIGLHLSSNHDTGKVALVAGPAMAATDSWLVHVHGHGGHAASPHQTVDPIVIASQAITMLQTLVSRETDPQDSSVISVTSIHAGNSHNVIPEVVEIKGTLRTFDADTRARLRERLPAVFDGIAVAQGGSSTLQWVSNSPAVVNDAARTQQFSRIAAGVLGQENVLGMVPIMGGDDMALWLQEAAGTYFFVGARNASPDTAYPHHHPRFDIDEASLPIAIELLAKGVEEFLRE